MSTRLPFISAGEIEANCAAIDGLDSAADAQVDAAIESATELMWHLTGRQFGLWTGTVRPDLDNQTVYRLELGEYPVTSVQSVKIDGETLPASAYWVSDDKYLLRTDETPWPATQKPYLADTESGTFSVTFSWGVAPPPSVRSGTRRLACELLALAGDRPHSLSDRVRTVTRQGQTYDLLSADDLLNKDGRTGIFEVDLAIQAFNAGGNVAPALIFSPEDFTGGGQAGGAGGGRGSTQGPPGLLLEVQASATHLQYRYEGETSWTDLLALAELQGEPGEAAPTEWTTLVDSTLTATAASITVTGLGGYEKSRFRLVGRSTDTLNSITSLRVRFENDSASNYGSVQSGGSNTGNVFVARDEGANSATYIKAGMLTTRHTAATRYGLIRAETIFVTGLGLPAYTEAHSMAQSGGAVPDLYVTHHSGVWRNPSSDVSIGSMTLFPANGDFDIGTRLLVEVASSV